MNRKKFQMNTGIISLMLIFITLCLVTFAVLSLVSSQNAYQKSLNAASKNRDYILASNQGYMTLDQIDQDLHQIYSDSQSEGEYYQRIFQYCHEQGYDWNNQKLEFRVEISNQQSLHVGLSIVYGQLEHSLYRIDKWQVMNDQEWNPDNDLNVFK